MEKVVIGLDRTLDGTGSCQSLEQTLGLILVIHNIFAQLKLTKKFDICWEKWIFDFTCSSSWIEAARGRPSATLAIMVIKIIFFDLRNFESDTKHQSASKSSNSVYISRWEWHWSIKFWAQFRKNFPFHQKIVEWLIPIFWHFWNFWNHGWNLEIEKHFDFMFNFKR